ncbi:hypothetical protein A6R68_03233, partial [Neotoma lepida]
MEWRARGLRMPLLLLLVTVVVMAKATYIQRWGGFKEKATSMENMNSTLHFLIQSYNNASHDTYLFRVQKLIQSQMQLTTGVEYLVTVKIGRTKCKKNETKKASCPLQSSKMKKSLICTSLVYTVPWMNYYRLWNNSCQGSRVSTATPNQRATEITVLGATLGKSLLDKYLNSISYPIPV